MKKALSMIAIVITALLIVGSFDLFSQDELPYYLKDRGREVPTSMFGTYIETGEFIIYPFYEFYHDENTEYAPEDFGYGLDEDFRGRYRAHEVLLFFGYGITDRLVVECEAAYITAKQYRSPDDPTGMPDIFEESGLGDVESQIRWRWSQESPSRPGIFSYFETVFPLQKDRDLIGTQDWEFKLGSGVIKGFSWGTMTLRVAAEYSAAEEAVELGEYAIEYLINNAFGVTSKATDYAPEVGILFHF